jgi:hypothetical protein
VHEISLRWPADRCGCDAALDTAGRGNGVRTIMLDSPKARDAIVGYVREGDLAQLSDAGFRKELLAWLRFSDASAMQKGDGLAARTFGQPSMPDWLGKNIVRFALTGKSQARRDEKNIRSSPLIAVFVAEQDGPSGWVETGRVCERFALQATALGIRVAFINQPIEVRRLRPQLHSALGLKGETALLMLRVGHGPQASFSLRRPVDNVILAT